MSVLYPSIQIGWSQCPSDAEIAYRGAGMVRTQGTLLMLPPDLDILINTYTAPPRPKTLMSSGATALCKHFERGGASSEKGKTHPFWPLPRGSNSNKDQLASQILEAMLKDAVWKNVMMLHQGVAVYEIRNSLGYGMRWTLNVERQGESARDDTPQINDQRSKENNDSNSRSSGEIWKITETKFRGFLEPIEGLDHELPAMVNRKLSKD